MNLFTGKCVGVSSEEKSLPYYKYFLQEPARIPTEKLAVLAGGAAQPEKLIPFDARQLFLEGKDEAAGFCQIGFGIAPDGTGVVCNTTYMPGVTSEMLDWWFPWHSVGSDLRYKIWDREDHYFATAHPASYVVDPSVPMNEKTWGVSHYIMEDIGAGPEFLKLNFKKPSDLGFDMSAIGTEKCTSMVCGIGESSCAAVMTHKWYTHKDGVMFCSRFWVGFSEKNGKIEKTLPEGIQLPVIIPQGLFAHNIKEFANLSAILPSVYSEQKGMLL